MNDFIRNPKDLKVADLLPDRPTIGNDMSVLVWRMVRLIGLYDILGDETETITYFSGKKIGKLLDVKNIDELKEKMAELKIGKIECFVEGNLVKVSIKECFTCAGIAPPLGRPICHLEAGIVAGALENIYEGKKISAEETKCIGGLGDDACVVECMII